LSASPTTAAEKKIAPRLCTARVSGIEDMTPDTRILRLTLTGPAPLEYRAGQYANIHAPGLEPRAFSIASPPHDPELEFHVKNTGRGISAYIFNALTRGAEVTLEGPFGNHYWRPLAKPLIALAGGVGIAPMKAIVETHLLEDSAAPVWLYWGVKNARQLYLDSSFRHLAEQYPRFHYTPLLAAAPEGQRSPLRVGSMGAALSVDFPGLSGCAIYMAGPAAMIDDTLPQLLAQGAERDFIYSDAFGG
jgi:NAD(P)H-flavin reductase